MSVGVSGCQWVSGGVSGCQWVSVGVSGCQWVSVGVSGCQWVSVGVNGCQWVSSFLTVSTETRKRKRLKKGLKKTRNRLKRDSKVTR